MSAYGLESNDLAGLCRDVVNENATPDLGAEVVAELVAGVRSVYVTFS